MTQKCVFLVNSTVFYNQKFKEEGRTAVKNFARIYSVMHSENVKQHRGEEGCCLQLRFCSTILYRNSFLGKR